MRARRTGYTLVELLVALTLLGVGVATWVGTSAVALRTATDAERELAAMRLARDTAERLAARCGAAGSGAGGGTRWTIADAGAGVRHVRVEALDWLDGAASAAAVAEIAAACPP
jgi:prepilin-type N-terminal cleavage/methylation domain-containing protein